MNNVVVEEELNRFYFLIFLFSNTQEELRKEILRLFFYVFFPLPLSLYVSLAVTPPPSQSSLSILLNKQNQKPNKTKLYKES